MGMVQPVLQELSGVVPSLGTQSSFSECVCVWGAAVYKEGKASEENLSVY